MTKSYQGFEGDLELANSARSGLATLRARDSAGAEHTLSLDPDTAILSIDGSPISYVVESGSNANGFYRKHSDGFIEQWGLISVSANVDKTTQFPIAFTTLASIKMDCTVKRTNSNDPTSGKETGPFVNATTTSQWVFYSGPDAAEAGGGYYWGAQGY